MDVESAATALVKCLRAPSCAQENTFVSTSVRALDPFTSQQVKIGKASLYICVVRVKFLELGEGIGRDSVGF